VLSTKNTTVRQKACLPVAFTSLNNGHSSNLRAYCVGVRFSSRPNLGLARPLRPCNAAWRSSFVVNLSSITLRHAPTIGAEAYTVTSRCRVTVTTLARSFIWPSNNSVLSHYTNSFSVSPSFTSKPMRRRLSLCSFCLNMSARVFTTWLTTWRTFLAITVVHLGFSANVALAVMAVVTSCSISWLIVRLLMVAKDAMFLMVASILDSSVSTGELLVLRPMTSQSRPGLPGRSTGVHCLGH